MSALTSAPHSNSKEVSVAAPATWSCHAIAVDLKLSDSSGRIPRQFSPASALLLHLRHRPGAQQPQPLQCRPLVVPQLHPKGVRLHLPYSDVQVEFTSDFA